MLKNIPLRSFLLIILDLAAVLLAYVLAFFFHYGFGDLQKHAVLYLSFAVFPVLFYVFDLYYPFKLFQPAQTLVDAVLAVSIGAVAMAALAFLDRSFVISRFLFVYLSLSLIPLVFLTRMTYDGLFRSRFLDKKTLILGTGPMALEIGRIIKETPHSGMEVVGLVYEARKPVNGRKNGFRVVGGISKLVSLIDWYNIQLVVLALDPKEEVSEAEVMSQVLAKRVAVTSAIHLFEKLSGDVPYKLLGSHYLLGLMSQVKSRPYLKLKRLMDFTVSVLLLILLLPVLLIAVLALSFSGPGKIFFLQERIGRDGVPFKLIKLRSMTVTQRGRPVVTRFGRWMRRYRIDEIPQLVNILKGEMSLIGPRPEIPYFVARSRKKIPFYDAVFAVKPGLTGWAQVRFRHATSVKEYDQKFRYNLYYLKNISLALDFLIFLKTIRVVLLGRGE